GLVGGIQKHSKSGAQVCNIIEDISMYDMKSFSSVVVMVGGNDTSNRTDTELFEEKYDQLISLIKMGNQDCDLYISKIVPRGDTDIQEYNSIISRLATYWENHGVYLIQATEDMDNMAVRRYVTIQMTEFISQMPG
ncbi:MAG: SGNH/GDSL hydrolase family protein, partial [Candidatus Thiodiazotropha endolucinida]|nr:SGNH/GDSL hydrolase family protein [Candidatus Thiodiazotropha taylori]MCW4345468.1 SGNH/GDSL hydrolase family protein [Candidatus Thiodiazotropha endolucinida]